MEVALHSPKKERGREDTHAGLIAGAIPAGRKLQVAVEFLQHTWDKYKATRVRIVRRYLTDLSSPQQDLLLENAVSERGNQ